MPRKRKRKGLKKRIYKGRPIWETAADLSFKDFDAIMKKMAKRLEVK